MDQQLLKMRMAKELREYAGRDKGFLPIRIAPARPAPWRHRRTLSAAPAKRHGASAGCGHRAQPVAQPVPWHRDPYRTPGTMQAATATDRCEVTEGTMPTRRHRITVTLDTDTGALFVGFERHEGRARRAAVTTRRGTP